MSERTKIQWCDSTVNFWSGCTKVSAGCAHCYAEALSSRSMTKPNGERIIGQWGPGAPRRVHESAFKLAERLNRKPCVCDGCGDSFSAPTLHAPKYAPGMVGANECCGPYHRRRVFSLSLGDWLDPEVPVEWLARMLDTIRRCQGVTWMLVTKRPELFEKRLRYAQLHLIDVCKSIAASSDEKHEAATTAGWLAYWRCGEQVPQNVMVLASIEDQRSADERIPNLLLIPARWHGVSAEPLLGPIDLKFERIGLQEPTRFQVIIGGESGRKARPCNVEWVRDLAEQGERAGVARFIKQLGSEPEGIGPIPFVDPKGADPSEWREDLRIRQWPDGV